jgi:large subunit ribosomal protein L6
MSKIGRKPISTKDVQIEVKGSDVHYKGPQSQGIHALPECLKIELNDKELILLCDDRTSDNKRLWGLNRALLSNKIEGARKLFEQGIVITGLGYKGQLSGNKITFSLGFSHKIDFSLPEGITVDIDKSGQKLTVKGVDREKVGFVSSKIRALRAPEPYKGTGIKWANEQIFRKVGKKSG